MLLFPFPVFNISLKSYSLITILFHYHVCISLTCFYSINIFPLYFMLYILCYLVITSTVKMILPYYETLYFLLLFFVPTIVINHCCFDS